MADTDSSWMLPYGDLMTLLVAVFVMIAAMSDLRPGERFRRVSGGVRRALGFTSTDAAAAQAGAQVRRPPTLLERLERAGFAGQSRVHLLGPDDEVLAPCDVLVDGEALTVRIAGPASFAPYRAGLEPAAGRALRRIAEFLADGSSRIEIRGRAGGGPLPAEAPFRDVMDLSYARARAVADALAGCGVDRGRLVLTMGGRPGSPTGDAEEAKSDQAPGQEATRSDGVIEIVVHAVPTAGQPQQSPGRTG
ncbi:MAG: OmpA family protein [Planctomycetes bacterium]|nr:OmpA family protein [Planctomycetota bacterium]